MNQSDLKFQYGQTQKQMLSEKRQAEKGQVQYATIYVGKYKHMNWKEIHNLRAELSKGSDRREQMGKGTRGTSTLRF